MKTIQLTDEERDYLLEAINSHIGININNLELGNQLNNKLTQASNTEPHQYSTKELDGNHPLSENHLEEFDDMDSGDYPDSYTILKGIESR